MFNCVDRNSLGFRSGHEKTGKRSIRISSLGLGVGLVWMLLVSAVTGLSLRSAFRNDISSSLEFKLSPSVDPALTFSDQSVIHVPNDFPTIQEALNHAQQDYTILVGPGTYVERVVIDKSVRVLGSGDASIVQAEGALAVVEISADDTVFAGFLIEGLNQSSSGVYVHSSGNVVENLTVRNNRSSGIYLLRASRNLLRNNNVLNNLMYGIHIYDSGSNRLQNNSMWNNKYNFRIWGLYTEHFLHEVDDTNMVNGKQICYWVNQTARTVPPDCGCVVLVNSTDIIVKDLSLADNPSSLVMVATRNCLIWNNSFSRCERAIYLISSNSNYLLSNTLKGNYWSGISLVSSSYNVIAGNLISQNRYGIVLSYSPLLSVYSQQNLIGGNTILDNHVSGLYFDGSSENSVYNNEIDNNYAAINLGDSDGNVFFRNIFGNSSVCTVRIANSYSNTFFYNDIADETVVEFLGSTCQNAWDNETCGNYWRSRQWPDLDGDGVGDIVYQLGPQNEDRFPLINPPRGNTAPAVDFALNPSVPKVLELVEFHASADDVEGGILLKFWVFGSSEVYLGDDVYLDFVDSQYYSATLFVVDGEGSISSIEKSFYVRRILTILTVSMLDGFQVFQNASIVAKLTDETGLPVRDSEVRFYLVDGSSLELLRSARTDFFGEAIICYVLNVTGVQSAYVEYDGDFWHGSSNARHVFSVYPNQRFELTVVFAVLLGGIIVFCIFLVASIMNRRKRRLNKRGKVNGGCPGVSSRSIVFDKSRVLCVLFRWKSQVVF